MSSPHKKKRKAWALLSWHGARALRRWHHETKPGLPKCSANAKHTGAPCQQLALDNGKCRHHGGRTPKGAGWHKIRWPNADAPDVEEKLSRKIRDHQLAKRKRTARLAAMTPEERAAHEAWQWAHKPGPAAARETRRRERKQAAEIQAALERPTRSRDPAIDDLQRTIDELQRRAGALRFDIFD